MQRMRKIGLIVIAALILLPLLSPLVTAQEEIDTDQGLQAEISEVQITSKNTKATKTASTPAEVGQILSIGQSDPAADVQVEKFSAYLSDEYGNRDPDQIGEYVTEISSDGQTWVGYKRYTYCVPVSIRTIANVEVTLSETRVPFAILKINTWSTGITINPYNPKYFVVVPSANVVSRAAGVNVNTKLSFQITAPTASWGTQFRTEDGRTWDFSETWTGIQNAWIGSVEGGIVPIGLIYDRSGTETSPQLTQLSTTAISSTHASTTAPAAIAQRSEETSTDPIVPATISLGSAGSNPVVTEKQKIGSQDLAWSQLSQKWTVQLSSSLTPRFYYVKQLTRYNEVTLTETLDIWGWHGSSWQDPRVHGPVVVGGVARNVYAHYKVIFSVVIGSKYVTMIEGEPGIPPDLPRDLIDDQLDDLDDNLGEDQIFSDWQLGTGLGGFFGWVSGIFGGVQNFFITIIIFAVVGVVVYFIIRREISRRGK